MGPSYGFGWAEMGCVGLGWEGAGRNQEGLGRARCGGGLASVDKAIASMPLCPMWAWPAHSMGRAVVYLVGAVSALLLAVMLP